MIKLCLVWDIENQLLTFQNQKRSMSSMVLSLDKLAVTFAIAWINKDQKEVPLKLWAGSNSQFISQR